MRLLGGGLPVAAVVLAVALSVTGCTSSSGPQAKPPSAGSTATRTSSTSGGTGSPHAPRASDAVAAERGRPGTSSWKLTRPADNGQIEGYADQISGLPGSTATLRVSTQAPSFKVQAYRFGYYRGGEARQVWASGSVRSQPQPGSRLVQSTRTVVAPWRPSLRVPTSGWAPGAYLFKLTASNGFQAYVPYFVRSPSVAGRVALVAPVTTWEAYNNWGGYSLYVAPPGKSRSWAVSFDRPFPAPGANPFFYSVLPVVVAAEKAGVPLAYLTTVDVNADPHVLNGARAYVDMGHDEYWTNGMRSAVLSARDAGTNLAFLGADTGYWRIRLENRGGPSRWEVGYKTDAGLDPMASKHPGQVTGAFRDGPHPQPENTVTGVQYECFPVDTAYRVVSPQWWGFAGTGVRSGTEFPHLVGIEADRVYPIPSTPRPLQVLSYSPYDCRGVPTTAESAYYTTRSGAGVFSSGTLRWTCALKTRCADIGSSRRTRTFVRKVTSNLLHTMSRGPVGRRSPAHDNVSQFDLPTQNQVPAS